MKKLKKTDIVGIICAVFIIAAAIVSIVLANRASVAGASGADIPSDAVTLSGTAEGRNGTVTVSVVATADRIYQVKVAEHSETQDIGTKAVDALPGAIYENQSLKVDGVSGATLTSDAIKQAVYNALVAGGFDPAAFGGADQSSPERPAVKVEAVADKVKTGSKVTLLKASDWASKYPEIYASYMQNSENDAATDYLVDYPMLPVLYEGFGFAKFYSSARGHYYDVDDIHETGRPHKLANCYTCKTANFTATVNELGDQAYSMTFEDMKQNVSENISCYNCHANDVSTVTVTHTYLTDAMGEDFDKVDAATLSCAQCHVEYYFSGEYKATTLPYSNLATMNPDDILALYNDPDFEGTGDIFYDYTNPRTGVKQIKVQHPEYETFLGEGSVHRGDFTCATCHMGESVDSNGNTYPNHYLTSPLDNEELIESTCSQCHTDIVSEVRALEAAIDARTNSIGYALEMLTEKLAAAAATEGVYTAEELDQIRMLARNAQFYWDFVFVENSEGAHNSTLTNQCLDKAENLVNQAMLLFK